jgi:hypothetical protein
MCGGKCREFLEFRQPGWTHGRHVHAWWSPVNPQPQRLASAGDFQKPIFASPTPHVVVSATQFSATIDQSTAQSVFRRDPLDVGLRAHAFS